MVPNCPLNHLYLLLRFRFSDLHFCNFSYSALKIVTLYLPYFKLAKWCSEFFVVFFLCPRKQPLIQPIQSYYWWRTFLMWFSMLDLSQRSIGLINVLGSCVNLRWTPRVSTIGTVFLVSTKFSKLDKWVEPIYCKKQQKKVPGQLLVFGKRELWRFWMV